LEEEAPTLVFSNLLITDAVNLLNSLIGVKFTFFGVGLFISALLNAEGLLLLIGVAKLSILEEMVAVDLTGVVVVNLEAPLDFINLKEETGGFFLLVDAETS
jgi:hypothetical protein